jgi:NitT/TauT family transport system ATP-binding protein
MSTVSRTASENRTQQVAGNNATGRGLLIEGISKSFKYGNDSVLAIRNLDLHVKEGEFVSVVGPSGSGKTTLLNLIAGFIEPTTGSVTVDGKVVTKPGPERCMVFQEYAVFPWLSVWNNIEFGLKLRARRRPREERSAIVKRYIEIMGLGGFERAIPRMLSGGMRQRVAIARAYAVEPEVLLMDEPFAALDAQTRDNMQEQLVTIRQEERRTVMFVTHSVEEAIFLSDRVIVLTPRPAEIQTIIDIDLPYPRTAETKTSEQFIALRRHIEGLLRQISGPAA